MRRRSLIPSTSPSIDKGDCQGLPRGSDGGAVLTDTERRPAHPGDLPTLKLSRNGAVLQELSLDGTRLLIGRSAGNDMSIPSNYASRHHILLVRHAGSTILIDLNSTNGTFVNSKRVHNHVKVLTDGDVIEVDLHHKFVQYRIRYNETRMSSPVALGGIGTENAVIEKALADIGSLLEKDDTDLIPTPSENLPTEMGFLDDR